MKVYVFGNEDLKIDNQALLIAEKLKNQIPDLEFIEIRPNADLPFINEDHVVLMDVVQGIDKVMLMDETNIDRLVTDKSITAHDYDLGFQLKYLKKLGKIRKFTVISLPQEGEIDYLFIQSTLRKLVAQDIQGS